MQRCIDDSRRPPVIRPNYTITCMVLICTYKSRKPAVVRSNFTTACMVQAVLGFQLLHPFACTRWQVGGARVVRWLGDWVITIWPGGKAGGWCQSQWPPSRGSLPPPPTRGCCWTGTHTQTDASHLQSQSQSCLVVDDRWCQRLHHFNTIMTVSSSQHMSY